MWFRVILLMAVWLSTPRVSTAASSVTGTIRDSSGGGLQGLEVRLWKLGEKDFDIHDTRISSYSGAYVFSGMGLGTYKLDARMPAGMGGNYGDRWYDVAEPCADGWIGDDADTLDLTDDADLTGYDITMLVLGGMDGLVRSSTGDVLGTMLIRVERIGERRIHHNDLTKPVGDPYQGEFFMRGMVPSDDYRVIVADPTGVYETLVLPGPFTITSEQNTLVPTITLSRSTAVDPYESNNSTSDALPVTIDADTLRQNPNQAFETAGAFIGPTPDADYYCFEAEPFDHLLIDVSAYLDLGDGEAVLHPFFDTVLGVWNESRGWRITNDDVEIGNTNSKLDIELDSAERHCIAVSSYPDLSFFGYGQSTGTYTLSVAMVNRRPQIAALYAGESASFITFNEGDSIQIDVTFEDLDGDPLTPTHQLIDKDGAAVVLGVYRTDVGAGTGTFSWTASQTAARGSPYRLDFSVTDGELFASQSIDVVVNGVNVAPTNVVRLQPEDDAAVASLTPTVHIQKSTDEDGDALSYEFELYELVRDAGPELIATESVAEDPSPETTWTIPELIENSTYQWRVRAHDGTTTSPWTEPRTAREYWTFMVDVGNDPPDAPVMRKPELDAILLVRNPTLEVENPREPEGEEYALFFEVAADEAFAYVVAASDAVAPSEISTTSIWQVDELLEWGQRYWARAWAIDARGGSGDYSNAVGFVLRNNAPPPAPRFGSPFEAQCEPGVVIDPPLPVVELYNVVDPDGDPVWLTVEVYQSSQNPEIDSPLVSASRIQLAGTSTTNLLFEPVPMDAGGLFVIRAAADDGFVTSPWRECHFTTPAIDTKAGCTCKGVPPSAVLPTMMAVLLCRRLRRLLR